MVRGRRTQSFRCGRREGARRQALATLVAFDAAAETQRAREGTPRSSPPSSTRARPTASGYEAVVDAGGTLRDGRRVTRGARVSGARVGVSRECSPHAGAGSRSQAALLRDVDVQEAGCVRGTERDSAFAGRHRLVSVDRKCAPKGRDFRVQLHDYLHAPKDHESDRKKATRRAVELLGAMSRAVKRKRFDTALGRRSRASSSWRPRFRTTAACASNSWPTSHTKPARAKRPYTIVVDAMRAARNHHGFIRDALEVALRFEWSSARRSSTAS